MVILQSMWTGPLEYQIMGTNLSHTVKEKEDLPTPIEEQPRMKKDFRQFSRNNTYVRNPFACTAVL